MKIVAKIKNIFSEGAPRPTAGDEPREFTSRGEGGRVPPFIEKLPSNQCVNKLAFREATLEDSGAICGLFKSSFTADLQDFFLFCRKGYLSYLQQQISIQKNNGESFFWVCEKDGEIMGAIEFRRFRCSLFINLIAIQEQFCGMGLGKALIFHSLETVEKMKFNEMHLDVLSANSRAKKFYSRLGFSFSAKNFWIKVPRNENKGNFEPLVYGFPTAMATYKEFSFGQFQIESTGKTFNIGIFGEKWLRVNHDEIISNGAFQLFLRDLFPDRNIFAILPQDGAASALENTEYHFASTERWSVSVPDILSRLSSHKSVGLL